MQVGDIVLFKIAPGVMRPFLLIAQQVNLSFDGTLFTRGEEDGGAEWVLKNCFFRPNIHEHKWTVFVKGADRGSGIGQWQPKGSS